MKATALADIRSIFSNFNGLFEFCSRTFPWGWPVPMPRRLLRITGSPTERQQDLHLILASLDAFCCKWDAEFQRNHASRSRVCCLSPAFSFVGTLRQTRASRHANQCRIAADKPFPTHIIGKKVVSLLSPMYPACAPLDVLNHAKVFTVIHLGRAGVFNQEQVGESWRRFHGMSPIFLLSALIPTRP